MFIFPRETVALHGEEDATQQAHLQNLFTRMQGSKGGNLTHKFNLRVFMSVSSYLIVLAFISE